MKKYIALLVTLFSITSLSAQDNKNTIIVDPDIDMEILIGHVDEEGLKNYDVFLYADEYYEDYKLDSDLISEIEAHNSDIEIKVVFGSWCGDSQANVPSFKKIVDNSKLDKSKIEYIAVNRKKTGGDYIDISELNVEFVPTFIFYKEGEEIGRIVENPNKSLEADWLEIIKK